MKKLMLSLALLALTANAERLVMTEDFALYVLTGTHRMPTVVGIQYPGKPINPYTVADTNYVGSTAIFELHEGPNELHRMLVVTPDSVHLYKAGQEIHSARSVRKAPSAYTQLETKTK